MSSVFGASWAYCQRPDKRNLPGCAWANPPSDWPSRTTSDQAALEGIGPTLEESVVVTARPWPEPWQRAVFGLVGAAVAAAAAPRGARAGAAALGAAAGAFGWPAVERAFLRATA